ncbi:DivIVA domain-containing protein [Micromonospora sp. C95]|nr:DivIVA domain-containing protein [Micromonospora sp. C95]
MRISLRRRAGRHSNQRGERYDSGTCYRAATYRPLRPWQVRERRFRLGRRGYDPVEVTEFLDRVAGDLEAAYRQVAVADREAAQVREALRRWQSEQAQARQARLNQPSLNQPSLNQPSLNQASVNQAEPHQRPANQGRHR